MTSGGRPKNPLASIANRLTADLSELIETAATASPSSTVRKRLDAELRELVGRVDAFLRELDPVHQPRFMFDPGNPAVVGRFIALAMISQPRVALNQVERFYGSGIYALYYDGDFSAYVPIKGTEAPIYVGKADPRSDTALDGRHILDVGCGNGYYALRMRKLGAASVTGIDPTLLYIMQFLAVNYFEREQSVFVLPLRLHELPAAARKFDTTFSMGVLYHQRSPIDHLRQLNATLRPEGQLVLETLFMPGDDSFAFTPADRYARMKNVWLLPTLSELTTWLKRSGFRNIEVVDKTITVIEEQRSTEWMTFESLAEALDPADSSRTIEGCSAPRRVIVTASSP